MLDGLSVRPMDSVVNFQTVVTLALNQVKEAHSSASSSIKDMNDLEYKWKHDGVKYTVRRVVHKTRGRCWVIWREWRDEDRFPHIEVEWVDELDEALTKYPGKSVQPSFEF